MLHLRAGQHLQHLARQMVGRAVARRTKAHLARVGAGVVHQFLQGLGRVVGVDHQHVHVRHGHRQRREVLDRVVADALTVQRRVDGVGAGGRQADGVAVGRRLGQRLHAHAAAGTAAVLDHHRLAQRDLQLLRHRAGEDVGRPAGRKGHDPLDRPAGPGVGPGLAGQHGGGQRQHHGAAIKGVHAAPHNVGMRPPARRCAEVCAGRQGGRAAVRFESLEAGVSPRAPVRPNPPVRYCDLRPDRAPAASPPENKKPQAIRSLGVCIWRRGRDSNPRGAVNPHTLSRRAT